MYLGGAWKCETEIVTPRLPPEQSRSVGYAAAFEPVAGGWFCRGRTHFGPSREVLTLYGHDHKGNVLRYRLTSDGVAAGPAIGVLDASRNSLSWIERLPDGTTSFHQFEIAGRDSVKSRLFIQNAKNEIVSEVRMTFTRIPGPVSVPASPTDPNRPVEMRVLDRLVGEWGNEITITDSAAPDRPKAETTRVKAASVLGGRFVESIVTFEPDGHGDYLLAWFDPAAKLYRQWFFNGTDGNVTELTGTWDEAANALTWTSPDGRMEGRWVFKCDDVREFRHVTKAADGKVVNETAGVARRYDKGEFKE